MMIDDSQRLTAGLLYVVVKWYEPQTVEVKAVGSSYLFAFMDSLGRRRNYYGRYIAFGVWEFISWDRSKFLVRDDWRESLYCDFGGRWHDVTITRLYAANDEGQ